MKAELVSWRVLAEGGKAIFPIFRSWRRERKQLVYCGAAHCWDPSHAMFMEIEQRFSELNPQVVVVEGFDCLRRADLSDNGERLRADFVALTREEVIRQIGENGFAVWLAARAGVPSFCGEPGFSDEIAHLLRQGFRKDDIFLHYLIRAIDQYHRSAAGISFDKDVDRQLEWFRATAAWEGFDYSLAHLEALAARTWSGTIDLRSPEFCKEKVWPTRYESIVNEISRESSDFRELSILAEIRRCLEDFERVLVVYGGSHLVRELAILEEWFRA